jgi:hypothetical protein
MNLAFDLKLMKMVLIMMTMMKDMYKLPIDIKTQIKQNHYIKEDIQEDLEDLFHHEDLEILEIPSHLEDLELILQDLLWVLVDQLPLEDPEPILQDLLLVLVDHLPLEDLELILQDLLLVLVDHLPLEDP